jgi:pimeloyl-ACP methyl ester carboxylesterase
MTNRDPHRIDELAAELPRLFRTTLERFSPSTTVERLDAPLLILQSKKDAATPWTEAVLLDRAVPRSRHVLLDHFSHVDPTGLFRLARPRSPGVVVPILAACRTGIEDRYPRRAATKQEGRR